MKELNNKSQPEDNESLDQNPTPDTKNNDTKPFTLGGDESGVGKEEATTESSESSDASQPSTVETAVDTITPSLSSDSNEINEPQVIGPQQSKATKKTSNKLVAFIVVAVLLLGTAAAGWFYWSSIQPQEQQQTAERTTTPIETLRIGSVEGPANLMFPTGEARGISVSQNFQVYEGLIGSEDKKFVPLLAESWTNPDQKTWVFKLRNNVKFHTGRTMKAQDVKASLDSLREMEFWSQFVTTIESVEAVSDTEVKIVTKQPDALLLNRLIVAFIYDTEAADKSGNNGTGAYQIDTTKTNDENNSYLVAFDDYHQGKPKTRSIHYQIFENEDAIVAAVEKGQIDYTEMNSNTERHKKLTATGMSSLDFVTPGVFGMFMNIDRSEDSPLKDIEVRRAISHAIDRQGLIDELGGEGVPAEQVIPQSLPGYDPNASFPAYDKEESKKILDEKYPDGVTLEYHYFEGVQTDAPILIKQLEDAGFEVIAKPYTNPEILIADLSNGDFDLFSASYSSDIFDARDILGNILGKNGTYPTYQNDQTYDDILTASDQEFDPTKRIAALQEAGSYISENLLWIPIRKTQYTAYFNPAYDVQVDYEGGNTLGQFFWKLGQFEE